MELNLLVSSSLTESRYFICEDDEGPLWNFQYDNWKNDKEPRILLLGAYHHPSTGNNLVGGVNLHYLNKKQRDDLARALPDIMKQSNLKTRYRKGKSLLPDIFDDSYRTYDSKFIRGVQKDTLFPKYGFLKTAQNWLKKKLGGIFKGKAQRQKEAEPEYPNDLQSMQDRLDQAVTKLATDPPEDEPVDSPEMQAARKAFKDFQRKKTLQDIEKQEFDPLRVAQRELEQAQQQPGVQDAELHAADLDAPEPQQRVTQELTPEQKAQEFEQEEAKRQRHLSDPKNQVNPDMDLEESTLGVQISYYSPVTKNWITESV